MKLTGRMVALSLAVVGLAVLGWRHGVAALLVGLALLALGTLLADGRDSGS